MIVLIVRSLLALVFLFAGISHFTNPKPFMTIVPPALGHAKFLVHLSGVFEILGGLGMLLPATRPFAGWGLVLLLLAVLPANVYMATAQIKFGDFPSQAWMAWARIPFQFVIIAAVIWSCELRNSTS